jgi:hypothetical protein
MTTEIVAADSTLTPEQAELQARARAFVEERLGIADRIWEGTSEIQRLTVARALERRGVERVLH